MKSGSRKMRIVLACLVAFVLLFSAGSMIAMKNVIDGNFPRVDRPKFTGRLRYSDVSGYDRTVVHFRSGKNTLAGYIYGKANKKGLVVISHGLGYGADSYLAETMYFVDKGWRVFAFDNTGTFASEGRNTVGLPQSLMDLDAALTYIEGNDALKGLPIVLYGHSWGGYAVTAVLGYDHDIVASASIAGFNSPGELVFEQIKSMMGLFAYVEYPFAWAYQYLLFGGISRSTSVEGINGSDTPVMIIHGDEDEAVSYHGAGIIAHRSEITNPNVAYKTCSAQNRNGHKNLFLSEAAVEYISKINGEYKKLYDSYSGKIPDDANARFYAGVDRFLTCRLDADFMDGINAFFEGSISK